jgi:spore coat polysaccharide biosynthesis protein SpsF
MMEVLLAHKGLDVRVGIIIQARTGSTRLPNKVLMDFHEGKTILEIIIDSLKSKFQQYPTILATSVAKSDDVLSEIAIKHSIAFFQGSENNVLQRFIEAAKKYDLTHVVRVCADNPFLNMNAIENLINNIDSKDIDYVSYSNHEGIPVIKTHLGLFAEVVSLKALITANELQTELIYKEHVTNYIYEHADKFNIKLLSAPAVVYKRSDIRLTLDDSDDFANLAGLYTRIFRQKEDLSYLVNVIDSDERVKANMIKNIKKYTK